MMIYVANWFIGEFTPWEVINESTNQNRAMISMKMFKNGQNENSSFIEIMKWYLGKNWLT